jgi:hypothetical protein
MTDDIVRPDYGRRPISTTPDEHGYFSTTGAYVPTLFDPHDDVECTYPRWEAGKILSGFCPVCGAPTDYVVTAAEWLYANGREDPVCAVLDIEFLSLSCECPASSTRVTTPIRKRLVERDQSQWV